MPVLRQKRIIMLEKYYSATAKFNTVEEQVPAPYLRKSFNVDSFDARYELYISVVGIYELTINGVVINKGYLLPYRTNPNHIVYIDKYQLNKYLRLGENVIGVMLGNGFSDPASDGWDFDKVSWRHAPKIALEVHKDEYKIFDVSSFRTHPSEVVFDDFYYGDHIDANKIIEGWNLPDFDDSGWKEMIEVESPKGERLPHPSFYPTAYEEVKPVKVIKGPEGYIYDFGSSFTGMYQIKIKGEKGKVIRLFMNDAIREDKTIFLDNVATFCNVPLEYRQFDWFILSGKEDTFRNRFSYKAGRFVELKGLSDEEAKIVDITMWKVSSLEVPNNHFKCDNEIINKLQSCVINSDISNFFYFPTDCPHREKNGWTGDACMSAEQMLLNFSCFDQFKEWLKSIIKAQNEEGTIPGIVPTDTWGFAWGNGPGWDELLFELPLRSYIYSGDIEFLEMVHEPIIKYLHYMETKKNEHGLFMYGLGDWDPVRSHTPREVIDTLVCKHIADSGAQIFTYLKDEENAKYAKELSESIREAFVKHYGVEHDCRYITQAWASMSLYYDIFKGEQKKEALGMFYDTLKFANYYMDFGVSGNRVFWRLLADLNEVDLAVKMMTQDGYFSFKKWLDQGATTLFETFDCFDGSVENLPIYMPRNIYSFNHHFWGDISSFFYRHLAGLQINQPFVLEFAPSLGKEIKDVDANVGEIKVHIKYKNDKYNVCLYIPEQYRAVLKSPQGFKSSINELKPGLNEFYFVKE